MLVTRENTYKIMSIEDSEWEKYEGLGFFQCDRVGKPLSSEKPKTKKGEKVDGTKDDK